MNQRSFSNLPKIIALALALTVLAFAAGCSKNANTGNSTNSTNSSNTTNKTTTPTSSSGLSPKDTIKAYADAMSKRDFATARSYLSQGTIAMMEEGAKKQGKTVDEAMKEAPSTPVVTPEFGAENITGDTATVEIKGPSGQMEKMLMVKEGGQWKLAVDKMISDMMKSMEGPGKGNGAEDDDEDEHGSGNH